MKNTSRTLTVIALVLVGSLAAASPAAAVVETVTQVLPDVGGLGLLTLLG
ncbi:MULTISPECIES: hypothetical protein [unclassified Nocardiopsis]|nr:hypothetical protein [Nocardiopsis sp. TSRI0078]